MFTCRKRFALTAMVTFLFGFAFQGMVDAEIIAQWKFEDGDFLADSSGNGNTLANFGASCVEDLSSIAPGNDVADFNGSSFMRTASPLDLSPYRNLRISWWQKVATTTASIIWEHSESFVFKPGSIVADVNDAGIGEGFVGVWGGNTSVYNLDQYSHSYDNTWEHMVVEFDLDSGMSEDVVKVFRNEELVSVATGAQTTDTTSFLNDVLYIGARGGNSVYFTGSLDELTIETVGVPEPSTIALLLTVVLAFVFFRR